MVKKRGGKRVGAGRKATGRILISMRLLPETIENAKRIGAGNVRDGVELALAPDWASTERRRRNKT